MASYTRNPLVTADTYRRLIEHGLAEKTQVVSIIVPTKYLDVLIAHFKTTRYTAFAGAARSKTCSRLTVYDREQITETSSSQP